MNSTLTKNESKKQERLLKFLKGRFQVIKKEIKNFDGTLLYQHKIFSVAPGPDEFTWKERIIKAGPVIYTGIVKVFIKRVE